MDYRKLGRTGLKVSEFCLGTMTFRWTSDEAASLQVLDHAWDSGINFIDTADVYSRWAPGNPGGVAEEIIGKWMQGKPRDQIIVATKCRAVMWDGTYGDYRSTAANGDEPASTYRDVLQQLIEGLRRENLTALFSHEIGLLADSLISLDMAAFLADTVIELSHDRKSRLGHRSIEIVKSRGQQYVTGDHTLRITAGQGLHVFRRVQAPVLRNLEQPTSHAKRSVIGVQALDDLIGGGLFDGSTTMVIGISGAGKTVLGTQLLLEGAVKQGRRGLLISLDEHPAQIVRNAETLGLKLQEQIDAGMIHLLFESPQELEIDAHYDRIVRTIEEHDIQRLVIDGVSSYSTALDGQRAYRDFFHAIVAFSKFRLMTTFFNYENPELFGLSSYMPDFPVSSIVDNIIVISLVELGNTLHRCIAIVKARGCKHEFDMREFTIGPGGISLLPMDKSVELQAQPIETYSSVISRAPTRVSSRPRVPVMSPK